MGHFLATLFAKLFADEIKVFLPSIAERITKVAVRRLPERQRERYDEEWRSHVNEVPGAFAKVWVACGFLTAATQMPFRIGGFALYLAFLPLIALVKIVFSLNERSMYTFPLTLAQERVGEMVEQVGQYFKNQGYSADQTLRFDAWVKSREIPLARFLHESLEPTLPLSRIYEKKTHYAFWRPSFLEALAEYLTAKRLNRFLFLSTVMSGEMPLQSWLESLFEDGDSKTRTITLRWGKEGETGRVTCVEPGSHSKAGGRLTIR
jgi:hypothetical protein